MSVVTGGAGPVGWDSRWEQTGHLALSTLALTPTVGFEGQNCELNVDDCPGHQCLNGGTCVDGVNTYNCQCPPEWTGKRRVVGPGWGPGWAPAGRLDRPLPLRVPQASSARRTWTSVSCSPMPATTGAPASTRWAATPACASTAGRARAAARTSMTVPRLCASTGPPATTAWPPSIAPAPWARLVSGFPGWGRGASEGVSPVATLRLEHGTCEPMAGQGRSYVHRSGEKRQAEAEGQGRDGGEGQRKRKGWRRLREMEHMHASGSPS